MAESEMPLPSWRQKKKKMSVAQFGEKVIAIIRKSPTKWAPGKFQAGARAVIGIDEAKRDITSIEVPIQK